MEDKISTVRLDLLKELGNIGMGNALSSLSEMLKDEKIQMEVPEVRLVSLGELVEEISSLVDDEVAGLYINVEEEIKLYLVLLFPMDNVLDLVNVLSNEIEEEKDALGIQALSEAGNVISAGYLNALSFMMDTVLMPQPPGIFIDLPETVMSSILAESRIYEDTVIYIKTSLSTKETQIEGYLSVIPGRNAFRKIYNTFLKGK